MIGDAPQYEQLIQLYSTFGDEELRSLATHMNDLTDAAQQVLKVELAKRRIEVSAVDAESHEEQHDDLAESPLLAFAALAPAECVFEFEQLEQAYAARKVLANAGIESVIPDPQSGNSSLPRLVVAPDDAVTADLILSRPSPRDLDHAVEAAEDFVEPVCPQCGAVDPVLEVVDPTNEWRCESCDHTWSDPELPANG